MFDQFIDEVDNDEPPITLARRVMYPRPLYPRHDLEAMELDDLMDIEEVCS